MADEDGILMLNEQHHKDTPRWTSDVGSPE
jgi:hypothetical protein